MSALLDSMALKVLAALVAYPTELLVQDADEIAAMLRPDQLQALGRLLAEFRGGDLARLQERHAAVFDRTRELTRPLFEQLHGVAHHGTSLAARCAVGIGDHPSNDLPTFLERLAAMPIAAAQAVLAETGHNLAAIEARLICSGSAYSGIVGILGALGRAGSEFGSSMSQPLGFREEESSDGTVVRHVAQRALA